MAYLAVLVGFAALLWSADRFVTGAAALARHLGLSSLLIGMLVVGMGTSAPEVLVSVLAAFDGSPGLALGNAFGSNIVNIALILGLAAVIKPIFVASRVLRAELPILALVTGFLGFELLDGHIGRLDGFTLLAAFVSLTVWQVRTGRASDPDDAYAQGVQEQVAQRLLPLKGAAFWLVTGLLLLVASSRLLVWGAVEIAESLGVSDLIIGLTIVAIGTSLPELASSIVAARRNEHDLAFGNIIGSNLFNSLLVVGLAVVIEPTRLPPELLARDWSVMAGLTLLLFFFGYGFRGRPGRINRFEGAAFLLAYGAYVGWLATALATRA